jgi:hypothetical protein
MTEVTELAGQMAKPSKPGSKGSTGRLFNDGQYIAGIDGCARGNRYFLKDSLFRRLDFVLHFHRFDDQYSLTCFDLRVLSDEQTYDTPRHGGNDFSRTFFVLWGTFASAQRSRITNFNRKLRVTYPQVKVAGRPLPLYFVGAAIDQQRQYIAARHYSIYLHLFAIEPALPRGIDFL